MSGTYNVKLYSNRSFTELDAEVQSPKYEICNGLVHSLIESSIALLSLTIVRAVDVARAADTGSRYWACIEIFATLAQARAAFGRHHRLLRMFCVKLVERSSRSVTCERRAKLMSVYLLPEAVAQRCCSDWSRRFQSSSCRV